MVHYRYSQAASAYSESASRPVKSKVQWLQRPERYNTEGVQTRENVGYRNQFTHFN